MMTSEIDRLLDFDKREVVLRADFTELDDEQCVWTSMRFMVQGPRHPREGEWVYLIDRHGRGCMGLVETVNGWTARVRPDWGSWAPSEDRPPDAPARS